ncbi:hypothetical protein N7493_004959 [Penicillium malachiteum]|uniref:Large ribosomal subunit protein mL50 n=1 Tax=Penicillium malachiteum TaxID=1324776 RepID=A0AAD6MW61_9EURO|nr:hypothetical protein N7493_004959 [Penicillium malachiteum]
MPRPARDPRFVSPRKSSPASKEIKNIYTTIMRPAVRLPLREALYVCSNCRQETLPRISPIARQFRRYASSEQSSSFLDRTRRRLWSEKPPMTRAAEEQEGGLQAGSSEGADLAVGDNYVQADSWNGLDVIGFTEENAWLEQGSDAEADKYTRYDADVKPRKLPFASHQAAVEISIMQLLGKPLDSICEVGTHNHTVQQFIDACTFVGTESGTALRFPKEKTLDALVFVFNQIGGKTEVQVESPEKLILEKSVEGTSHSLSLADPAVKFAFAKRLSQLMGRRIPDQVISSADSSAELVAALSTKLKEKPINVVKKLAKFEKAGYLPPNLKFSSKRLTKADHDEDVGRKKSIITELHRRHLILEKDENKPSSLH